MGIGTWGLRCQGWCQEQKLFLISTAVTSALLWMHMAAYHPDPHLEDAMDAVTVINTPEGTGTGFFIDADGCMLTAAHVVVDSSGTVLPVSFRMHGVIGAFDGVVVAAIKGVDIALICSAVKPKQYLRIANTEGIKRGTRTYALGDTAGRKWNLTEGIVSRTGYKEHAVDGEDNVVTRYDIWITNFISWGNSGGPVINDHGDVIGMVIEWDDPARAGHPNGLNIAVPGTDLIRFLRTAHGE